MQTLPPASDHASVCLSQFTSSRPSGAVGWSAGGNTVERARVDSDSNQVRVIHGQGQTASGGESGGIAAEIQEGAMSFAAAE